MLFFSMKCFNLSDFGESDHFTSEVPSMLSEIRTKLDQIYFSGLPFLFQLACNADIDVRSANTVQKLPSPPGVEIVHLIQRSYQTIR